MASPSPQVVAILVLVSSLASPALAQEEPAAPYEVASVRLRYGIALRQGLQQDLGPGLQYAGWTPNDFAGSARYWFMPMVGGGVSAQREGFALFTTRATRDRVSGGGLLRAPCQPEAFALFTPAATRDRVSGGGLLRISAGPSARLMLGPITLEGLVGYQ